MFSTSPIHPNLLVLTTITLLNNKNYEATRYATFTIFLYLMTYQRIRPSPSPLNPQAGGPPSVGCPQLISTVSNNGSYPSYWDASFRGYKGPTYKG